MQAPRYSYFVILVLLLTLVRGFAQPKDNSPYSRLGLGDPVSLQMAANLGFGGLSAAYLDPMNLNLQNPASYAFLQTTVFEVGMFAKYAKLEGDSEAADIWSGNLQYLALGFPLRNTLNEILDRRNSPVDFGMVLSLQPNTTVGYDIQTTDVVADQDTTTNNFQGTGGTYKLMWGNSVRYKNFALGLNLGYLFGKLSYDREVFFDNLGIAYQDIFSDEISISGFIYDLGVQYRYQILEANEDGIEVPSGKQFIFGASGRTSTGFNTNSSKLYQGVNFLYPDTDTVLNVSGLREKGKLPGEINVGIMYEDVNKFRLGVETGFVQWSKYENEAKPEVLQNAWRVALGGEFIPDITSYNNYARRIRYRAGVFYGTDPRSSDNNTLSKYGISLGLGLPVILPRQQTTFVNLALELGRFGNVDALKETYAKLTLGFTLNDNSWFFKRKFN